MLLQDLDRRDGAGGESAGSPRHNKGNRSYFHQNVTRTKGMGSPGRNQGLWTRQLPGRKLNDNSNGNYGYRRPYLQSRGSSYTDIHYRLYCFTVDGAGDDTALGIPARGYTRAHRLSSSDRRDQVRSGRQHRPVILPREPGRPLRDLHRRLRGRTQVGHVSGCTGERPQVVQQWSCTCLMAKELFQIHSLFTEACTIPDCGHKHGYQHLFD